MALKDYKKPNWYPDADVKATKHGWVYTKNNNEVLSSISNLDNKLSKLDDETAVPNPPSVKIVDSLHVTLSGLANASIGLTIGESEAIVQTLNAQGTYTYVLTNDLTPNTILKATQTDEDDNVSPEGIVTVVNKDLKGSVVISSTSSIEGAVSVVAILTNILNGSDAKLYIGDTLAETAAIVNTDGTKTATFTNVNANNDGTKTATFTNVNANNETSVKVTVRATDLTGKEVVSPAKTQAIMS